MTASISSEAQKFMDCHMEKVRYKAQMFCDHKEREREDLGGKRGIPKTRTLYTSLRVVL